MTDEQISKIIEILKNQSSNNGASPPVTIVGDRRTGKKEERDAGVLERHAQTILISIITAAILFSASFMYTSNSSVTSMATRVEFMSAAINKLESKIDMMNTNYAKREDLEKMDERVRTLEKGKR